MSTHNADAPGALPLETRLVTSHVEPSSAPSHAPTPGTTSAPLRSPTSPTLPEPDPANLTLAVSHMLNALWAAPVTPATPSAATLEAPAPALPQAAQAPVAAPRRLSIRCSRRQTLMRCSRPAPRRMGWTRRSRCRCWRSTRRPRRL